LKSLHSVSLLIIKTFLTLFSTKSLNFKPFPPKHLIPPITYWKKYWQTLRRSTNLKLKLKYLIPSTKLDPKNLSKLHSIFWALITIKNPKSKRLSINLKSPSVHFLFVSLQSKKMIRSTKNKTSKFKNEKFSKLSFFKMDLTRLNLLSKKIYKNQNKISQLKKISHSGTSLLKTPSLEVYLGVIWAGYCLRYENLNHSTDMPVRYWWYFVPWSDTTKKISSELIRP